MNTNITIQNLRNRMPVASWQVRVDRMTPLGNPFPMASEADRDQVCNLYRDWLVGQLNIRDSRARVMFDRLLSLYLQYGKLELFCWCAPKRCHAESIRAALNYALSKLDLLKISGATDGEARNINTL